MDEISEAPIDYSKRSGLHHGIKYELFFRAFVKDSPGKEAWPKDEAAIELGGQKGFTSRIISQLKVWRKTPALRDMQSCREHKLQDGHS